MLIKGLYTIVDNTGVPHKGHVEIAHDLLKGGVKILQLRMKKEFFSPSEVATTARSILSLKKEYQFLFILNDYLDLARELKADGYHGGQDDPSIEEARKILGPKRVIGYSTHSLSEALAAEQRGVDYIGFGAIYPTRAKGPDHPIVGVDRLREVVRAVSIPVVAIGGIGRDNIEEVLSTGVASVAMISALTHAADIAKETQTYLQRLAGREVGIKAGIPAFGGEGP